LPEEKMYLNRKKTRYICIGMDLAVSEKSTADCTAIIPIMLIGESPKEYQFYVLPDIVNKKMPFPESVKICKNMYISYETVYGERNVTLVTEDVGCLKALPQQLKAEGIDNVRAINPGRNDKRTRLNMTAVLIKNGKILFPDTGAEKLIDQIVNFGVERYDDLADAFSYAIISAMDKPLPPPFIGFV
jgi:predicted phage terminase large subunit-like protein